jgi:hypothetical protein
MQWRTDDDSAMPSGSCFEAVEVIGSLRLEPNPPSWARALPDVMTLMVQTSSSPWRRLSKEWAIQGGMPMKSPGARSRIFSPAWTVNSPFEDVQGVVLPFQR